MTPYAAIHGITLQLQMSPGQWPTLLCSLQPWPLRYGTMPRNVSPGVAGQSLNLTVPFIAIMTLLSGGSISAVDVMGGALILTGVYLTLRQMWPRRPDQDW